jgi:hypothetical protein
MTAKHWLLTFWLVSWDFNWNSSLSYYVMLFESDENVDKSKTDTILSLCRTIEPDTVEPEIFFFIWINVRMF